MLQQTTSNRSSRDSSALSNVATARRWRRAGSRCCRIGRLGYYARAPNLLACARAGADRVGFPDDEPGLRIFARIGAYTAPGYRRIAFGRDSAPVDPCRAGRRPTYV